MKSQLIELQDFEGLQNHMEKYGISFAAPITTVIVDTINFLKLQNYEEVTIVLHDRIVPDSYRKNAAIWKVRIKDQVKYPFLRTFRKFDSKVYIRAANFDEQPNFTKRLRDNLNTRSVISIPLTNVPSYYRNNPYILVHRFKKENPPIYISTSIINRNLVILKK